MPDPDAPEALRALWRLAFRRMWATLDDPPTTKQDTISGFVAVKGAIGIGRTPPAPTEHHLPMRSLLPHPAPPEDPSGKASPDSPAAGRSET